jgi:hypothetical protein
MPRIAVPATIADALEASRLLPETMNKQLGNVPNMFRAISISPQTLKHYLVSDADLAAVKSPGYTTAQVIKIVQHVAVDTSTSLFNEVFQTEIDFSVATLGRLP